LHEIELKFVVPPEREAAVERAMRAAGARRVRLVAHYHDTAGGDLARHGIALRLRREGRSWVQTVKAAGTSRVARIEHNVVLGRLAGAAPAIDLHRHDGTAAEALLRAALEAAGGLDAPLPPRYGVEVRRLIVDVALPEAVVEVVLDQGRLVAGDRVEPLCEVEYELKSGDASALAALARRAVDDHGLWLSVVSKAEQAERLLRTDDAAAAPAARSQAAVLQRSMTGSELARAVVQACLDPMLANASEIAAGHGGEEHVHQLRVSIRRLRTAMRELGALDRGIDAAWEVPLVAAFRRLGEWRDAATVMAAVQPQLAAAGAPPLALLAPRGDPGEVVRDAAFQRVLLAVIGYVLGGGDTGPGLASDAAQAHVRDRLRRLHRSVARDGRRFERLDEAAQHRVRKRLKRLRYLAELVSAPYPHADVERYLRQLRPAQDALGAHNDTLVAQQAYEQAARSGTPEAWFAAGWLKARQQTTARECRKALRRVDAAPVFW